MLPLEMSDNASLAPLKKCLWFCCLTRFHLQVLKHRSASAQEFLISGDLTPRESYLAYFEQASKVRRSGP